MSRAMQRRLVANRIEAHAFHTQREGVLVRGVRTLGPDTLYASLPSYFEVPADTLGAARDAPQGWLLPDVGPTFECPLGAPGTVLWVAETWARETAPGLGNVGPVAYRADCTGGLCPREAARYGPWQPARDMPESLVRSWVEVCGVSAVRAGKGWQWHLRWRAHPPPRKVGTP